MKTIKIEQFITQAVMRIRDREVVGRTYPFSFLELSRMKNIKPTRLVETKWNKVHKELNDKLKEADALDKPVMVYGIMLTGDEIDDILEDYFE